MTPSCTLKRLWLCFCLIPVISWSQNLEEIGLKKGVHVNGSVNLSTIGYYAQGIDQRRDPFNFFVTGNLNLNLFGYSAPFSFSYSNANKNFSQPFNQFSFAPQYKWVRTYIGYNSMTFSSYTLAGHVFLGGGVELTPGKWKVAAMYGRLRKAVPFNLSDTLQQTQASFKRMGYGLLVGYENNGDAVSANIFTAKDDINSIPFVLAESQLKPEQNVAVALSFRKEIIERFFVEGEYAVSALNKDMSANDDLDTTQRATDNLVEGLLPENATSRYFDALNASVGYQGNWYTIRLKYERVAPEYQTLGAYYFNNDLENITIAPAVKLLQSTLNLSGNVGIQENNLDKTRESTTKRVVSAINASYVPGADWNFAVSYSNFNSYTNIRPQQDPFFQNNLDTLNFYQVSQTMSGTIMHGFGGKETPQSLMLNLSYQQANDRASYEGVSQHSTFKSATLSYNYSLIPSQTTLSAAGNVYANIAPGVEMLYWGPTLAASKSMMNKSLRASLATSYNQSSTGSTNASPVLNNRLSVSYRPLVKDEGEQSNHNLSFGANLLNRLKSTPQQKAYSEYTVTFNYTYSF